MRLIRSVFVHLFILTVVSVGYAQQSPASKPLDEKPKEERQKQENEKESFGDYVQKVGLGIWGRVKERLNLEDTMASLEEKKNKILGDKEKKDEKKELENKEESKDAKPEVKSDGS
jgi:hypothetical protein